MALFCLMADQAQWPLYDLRSKDRISDEVCPVFGRSARSPSHRTRSADRFVPLRFLLPARLATRGVCDRDSFEIELIGEIAAMVDLGAQNKSAGPKGSAVPDVYRRSVKVVAGARNHLDLLLSAATFATLPRAARSR